MAEKRDSVTAGLWWQPGSLPPQIELAVHLENVRSNPTYLEAEEAVELAYRLLSLAAASGVELDVEELLGDVGKPEETVLPGRLLPAILVPLVGDADDEGLDPLRTDAGPFLDVLLERVEQALVSWLRSDLSLGSTATRVAASTAIGTVEKFLVEHAPRVGGSADA